jgi:hypothetical protein
MLYLLYLWSITCLAPCQKKQKKEEIMTWLGSNCSSKTSAVRRQIVTRHTHTHTQTTHTHTHTHTHTPQASICRRNKSFSECEVYLVPCHALFLFSFHFYFYLLLFFLFFLFFPLRTIWRRALICALMRAVTRSLVSVALRSLCS